MPIVKRKRTTEFTVTPNKLAEDNNVSFEARGLLWYLLAKPADWSVQVHDIQRSGRIGRDKAYRLLNELINAGYIEKKVARDRMGRIVEIEYIVYDVAMPSLLPIPEIPEVDIPLPENTEVDPLPENTTSGLSGSGSAGYGKGGNINKNEKKQKKHSPLPPGGNEHEAMFAEILSGWPKATKPKNIDATKAAFFRLDLAERRMARDHASGYVVMCIWYKKPAYLNQYLNEKGWEVLKNDPPKADDGYFLIKPYRPEWPEWLRHIENAKGEGAATKTRRKGSLLAATRWPKNAGPDLFSATENEGCAQQ